MKSKNSFKIKSPKNLNTIFGLPSKSYTDNEFWEKECNTVLSNGWLFIGFVHELTKPECGIAYFCCDRAQIPKEDRYDSPSRLGDQ